MLLPKNNKTILVAPLDWGLGHATRCIPLIRELQWQGCTVLIAADGAHAALLQQEFPQVEILPLQGYGIRYGKGNLMLQLLRQLPRFLQTIRQEHRWLQQLLATRTIDGVISDNRYGLHTSAVPSVFITHQLQVQAPRWLRALERPAQKSIGRLIEKFGECWVPDVADEPQSLAKKLSHPPHQPAVRIRYIGWLTRITPQATAVANKYRLMISLSGPEPQRSILEKEIFRQLPAVAAPVLLVRGLPGRTDLPTHSIPGLTIVNHVAGTTWLEAIASSDVFLSRCGYSTLMDLQTVSCRCIFIPTPGQTEQEYLGGELGRTGRAVVLPQTGFNLPMALQQAAALPPFSAGDYTNEQLPLLVSHWLATIA